MADLESKVPLVDDYDQDDYQESYRKFSKSTERRRSHILSVIVGLLLLSVAANIFQIFNNLRQSRVIHYSEQSRFSTKLTSSHYVHLS